MSRYARVVQETHRAGRPRSEQARAAVLHAVDDMVVEIGYAAMTMKGIAERAGVGRQTVYRWWSTKAEILLEACVFDARKELAITPTGDAKKDLAAYVDAVRTFLTTSDAGIGYRALVGEAQHDEAVATLIASADVLTDGARVVLERITNSRARRLDQAAIQLVGPVFFWVASGRDPEQLSVPAVVDACLAVLDPAPRAARK